MAHETPTITGDPAEDVEVMPRRPEGGPEPAVPKAPVYPNDQAGREHSAEIVPMIAAEVVPPGEVSAEVVSVDQGEVPAKARATYADITLTPGERKPILPPALQGWVNVRATIVLACAQTWYRSRYHGIRTPLYLVALIVWAAIGAVRLALRQLHWWWVLEQHALRSKAVADGDSREWMKLHKEAKATRQARGWVLLGELVALFVAGLVVWRYAPLWAWVALIIGAVVGLARCGRPFGHRIIGTAIVPPDYSPPTHEIITQALGSLNIKQINDVLKPDKDGKATGLKFISDVMRDGPGWTCHLDLPHGVSASAIIARREDLASGLRRPLSATWPAGVPEEHPGRLDLWVGLHDISKVKPTAGPLVKMPQTDLFSVVPFGTSPRGKGVSVPMFETNWIIGASPGQGKTAAVRVLGCAAALDPLADLWIHELAGKGDLDPLAKVCHRYTSGLDDEAIAYSAESARKLKADTEERSVIFRKLRGSGQLPDGKVTRELAARYPELRPKAVIYDEVQNLLTDKQHGEQAAEDLAYVIRVGRAYGIIAILSTQRPDAKIIPTAISGLVICRFCLMVPDQPANDLVLGTSSYKRGYDATAFRPKLDAGLGWLKGGEDGIPQICRTYYLNLPATERIAARARDARDRAGVLSGYALGLEDVAEIRDILADTAAVFGGEAGLQWAELAERLAERWPGRWADLTAEAASAALRGKGVPSVDVKRSGMVAKGCRRVAVEREVAKAAAERTAA
jgi:S-DNA-T family DNA segregation ATPase FtsK/SpoIIIE